LPTVVLAGALALAGCGGGDDPMDDMDMDDTAMDDTDMDDTDPEPEPEPEPEVKNAKVPDDLTVVTREASLQATLQHGETKLISGLWYTCDGGTCSINIPAESAVSSVDYTGSGTLTIRAVDHRAADPTVGAAAQPTESTDPLSNDVLLKALQTGAARGAGDRTVWNGGTGNGDAVAELTGGVNSFTPVNGPRIDLRVVAVGEGVNAYWGYWQKSTRDLTGVPTDRDVSDRGLVWGGSTPYGKKPDARAAPATNGIATYAGGDNNVLFYYSGDGTGHNAWTSGGTGTLTLTADFGAGMVGGSIAPGSLTGITNPTRITNNNIDLETTAIGGDGTFQGSASFSSGAVARDSGNWNGGFFGPSVSGTPVQTHTSPGHAAGQFSVSRPEINRNNVMVQNELHIRGVFGGARE
ncbi:MAG: hypothetical protein OXD36_15255, partial [Rhodobacter sp.]|nr:hypothetical protein [Rhodobacter sp.]